MIWYNATNRSTAHYDVASSLTSDRKTHLFNGTNNLSA